MANTEAQFDKAIQVCRDVYSKKLKDYGAAWRIMRPCSITDQIFIKANRIRTLETKGNHCVDEGIQPELIGIVNYAIMGMIQLSKGSQTETTSLWMKLLAYTMNICRRLAH